MSGLVASRVSSYVCQSGWLLYSPIISILACPSKLSGFRRPPSPLLTQRGHCVEWDQKKTNYLEPYSNFWSQAYWFSRMVCAHCFLFVSTIQLLCGCVLTNGRGNSFVILLVVCSVEESQTVLHHSPHSRKIAYR
jgi:hypothetical protein